MILSIPSVHAGVLILLFLLAALLPLGVCVALICLHMIVTLTVVLPGAKKEKALRVLLDHVSDISLVLMALVVSLYVNPALPWISHLRGVAQLVVLTFALGGIVFPKMQFLRQVLYHDCCINRSTSFIILAISIAFLLCAPFVLEMSVLQVLDMAWTSFFSWRF